MDTAATPAAADPAPVSAYPGYPYMYGAAMGMPPLMIPMAPPPPPQPCTSLWIGNLHLDVTEDELRELFGRFGSIEHVKVLSSKNCAFIKYDDINSAIQAYQAMFGQSLHGQQIKVGWGKADTAPEEKGPPPCKNLWIGGMHPDTTEDEIAELFHSIGHIEKIRVIPHKSCAFVNFTTLEACTSAKNRMQGHILHGQSVRLNFGKAESSLSSQAVMPPSQFVTLDNPPPRVPSPLGPEKVIIDKIADYVIRNGASLEAMVMEKEKNNPKMSFFKVADPLHGYYRWKIYQLAIEKLPPDQIPTPIGAPPPWAAGPSTTISAPAVTPLHVPLALSLPGQLTNVPPELMMTDQNRIEFQALLSRLGLTGISTMRDPVRAALEWITIHVKHILQIGHMLKTFAENCSSFEKKLAVIHLITEVLRFGLRKRVTPDGPDDFSVPLKTFLPSILRWTTLKEPPENCARVATFVQTWADDNVYDKEFVASLFHRPGSSITQPSTAKPVEVSAPTAAVSPVPASATTTTPSPPAALAPATMSHPVAGVTPPSEAAIITSIMAITKEREARSRTAVVAAVAPPTVPELASAPPTATVPAPPPATAPPAVPAPLRDERKRAPPASAGDDEIRKRRRVEPSADEVGPTKANFKAASEEGNEMKHKKKAKKSKKGNHHGKKHHKHHKHHHHKHNKAKRRHARSRSRSTSRSRSASTSRSRSRSGSSTSTKSSSRSSSRSRSASRSRSRSSGSGSGSSSSSSPYRANRGKDGSRGRRRG
eukprot:TRINITY_DN402_c0_g1_i21.p1 TRINITY_DN402_c0_g1~~TRINITY_DN402_c0_g1_i21.p1  ORF type:complete len:859 (+),score=181.37 TRINITY_DN402_c0_g1_i21:284-2578(+)